MTTDKTAVLAAERLEPYTAAEHAAAEGHQLEYARDVPRACACTWQYDPAGCRYVVIAPWPGYCPWHTEEEGN